MAFTELDSMSALLVIDLQQGITGMPLAHPVDQVIDRVTTMIQAFRDRGLPIVLVNVGGSPPGRTDAGPAQTHNFPDGWMDLIPELGRRPEDHVVTKYTRSAFSRTGLAEHLRERGVTQVVVVGIATSNGVEYTVRDAHEEGFHVSVAVDAMTDPAMDAHERAVAEVFPRLAETGTTEELLQLMQGAR